MTSRAVDTPAVRTAGVRDWLANLAPAERRTFAACIGGWALDAMDVQIYSFVIPALMNQRVCTKICRAGVTG